MTRLDTETSLESTKRLDTWLAVLGATAAIYGVLDGVLIGTGRRSISQHLGKFKDEHPVAFRMIVEGLCLHFGTKARSDPLDWVGATIRSYAGQLDKRASRSGYHHPRGANVQGPSSSGSWWAGLQPGAHRDGAELDRLARSLPLQGRLR